MRKARILFFAGLEDLEDPAPRSGCRFRPFFSSPLSCLGPNLGLPADPQRSIASPLFFGYGRADITSSFNAAAWGPSTEKEKDDVSLGLPYCLFFPSTLWVFNSSESNYERWRRPCSCQQAPIVRSSVLGTSSPRFSLYIYIYISACSGPSSIRYFHQGPVTVNEA